MKSRIATLAITIACILFVAQPAVADTGVTWDGQATANCAPAAISGTLTGYTATSATSISLTGTITPCAVQGPSVYFGYIEYNQNGAHDARAIMPYGTTLVTDASTTLTSSSWTGVTAFCMAASPANRLSCVSVTIVGGLPVLAPIPTTDSRVLVPFSNGKGGGQGNCATCL